MIEDNIQFTQKEIFDKRIEITGTYSIKASLNIDKETSKNAGVRDEVRSSIGENIRRVITADVLDQGYTQVFLNSDNLRELVVDVLELFANEMRMRRSEMSDADTERYKMLRGLIYKVRTYNGG